MCITWHSYEDASKAYRKRDNILHLDSWKCKNKLKRKHMHLHIYCKTCFTFYQIIYWNRRKERKSNKKNHVNQNTNRNLNQVFLLSIYSSPPQLHYPLLRYFCSYAILNLFKKKSALCYFFQKNSIKVVGKFSQFLTPIPLPLANLANFWPLKKCRRLNWMVS